MSEPVPLPAANDVPDTGEREPLAAVNGLCITGLVLLCLSCVFTTFVVIDTGSMRTEYGPHEPVGFDFARDFAPLFGAGLLWVVLLGFTLCLAMRLNGSGTKGPIGRGWIWVPIAGLLSMTAVNVVYWHDAVGFMHDVGSGARPLWLALVLLGVALLVQAVRLARVGSREASPPRGLRPFLVTAVVATVAFLVVNGVFTFIFGFILAYSASIHD